MAKYLHDDVLDALLLTVADYGDRLTVCSAQPTTFVEATSGSGSGGYMLAYTGLNPSGGGPDYTLSDSASGRQCQVTSQTQFAVINSGTATHVAIVDLSAQKLLAVTTCTSQALTATGLVTTPAWNMVVNDPT
jgi:hypothetical protein